MDFERICMMFTMQESYYGILLSSMERKAVPASMCDTIRVGRSGNVFKLEYNKDFIDSLPLNKVMGLLKHEMLHVAFNHFFIFDELKASTPQERRLSNIAADMEVNCYIPRADLPENGCFAEDNGWQNRLGTREYYKRLLDELNQQRQNAQQPQQPCNGGKGGNQQQQSQESSGNNNQQQESNNEDRQNNSSNQFGESSNPGNSKSSEGNGKGNGSGKSQEQQEMERLDKKYSSIDSHDSWPENLDEAEQEMVTQMVEELVTTAAAEVEKSCGSIPAEMKVRIDSINQKKPKPVADWRRYFRRYIGHEFSELIRKSKKRESKRFPDAAGNRHQRKSNILVAIDTSGSVSMPEYMEFMGQIKTLSEKATFTVLECDRRIQHEYVFKGKITSELHGGGGTDFEPVIDRFIKERKKYDALIYFTDGYCDIPYNTPKETLWVISSEGDKHNNYKRNGASVVFIPNKNG